MTNDEGSQNPKTSDTDEKHYFVIRIPSFPSTFVIRASSLGFSFRQINHVTTPTAAPPKWANDDDVTKGRPSSCVACAGINPKRWTTARRRGNANRLTANDCREK